MTSVRENIENLKKQGKYVELIDLLTRAIRHESSASERSYFQIELSEAYYELRDFSSAKRKIEQLLPNLYEEDSFLIGEAENLLGKIYRIHQRYSEALEHYQKAIKVFTKHNHDNGLAKVYINMGNVFIFLEKFGESKKWYSKAQELAKKLNDSKLLANCYLNLGGMHYQNGNVSEALEYFEKTQLIFETTNDPPALAALYLNLAEVFFLRRDFVNSSSYSAKSALNYEQLGNSVGQVLALNTFARAEKALHNLENAISVYEEILRLQQPNKMEDILLELGECYLEVKQVEKAEGMFHLLIDDPSNTPITIGYGLNFLATIASDKGDFQNAKKYLQHLLDVLDTFPKKDYDSIAATKANLSYIFLKMGEREKSIQYLKSALEYFKKQKTWDEGLVLINNHLIELVKRKKFTDAHDLLYTYGNSFAKRTKDKKTINKSIYETALLLHINSKTKEGIEFWRKNRVKMPIYQYKAGFLDNIDLSEKEKKFLHKEHRKFLKMLTE